MELSELTVDLEELEADKRRNLEERRKFKEWYAEWLKTKTSYPVWLKAQKERIERNTAQP